MKRPAAILFDYGGVLTDVHHVDAGFREVADDVAKLLATHGLAGVSPDDIEADLRAANTAYEAWKQAQSRFREPRELGHDEFWELVGSDWPAAERAIVAARSATLCESFEAAVLQRPAKPDARDVLLALRARGVRTALVCNCLSAAAARREMRRDRLTGLLDAELFSDEVGMRKPNPGFILAATRALDVQPADCWFVGDKLNRDILGARRAGLAKAVLMSSAAGAGRAVRGVEPDCVVDSPTQLLSLLVSDCAS